MSKPPFIVNSNATLDYKPVKNETGADHISKHKNTFERMLKQGERSPKDGLRIFGVQATHQKFHLLLRLKALIFRPRVPVER